MRRLLVALIVLLPTLAPAQILSGSPYGSGAYPTRVQVGNSTGTATLGGVFCVNTTSAATTGTTEQILATCTLPANALSANGKGVRITAAGATAANANTKTFRIRFGGIAGTVVATSAVATASHIFNYTAEVFRTGASTQKFISRGGDGAAGAVGRAIFNNGTAAQTDTAAIDIVVTGTTPTAAGDLQFDFLLVEFMN